MTGKVMTKRSWRDVIPAHPAADLFPMMTRAELIALGEDIKANGLQTAPILWEAEKGAPYQLLDGRNRLDAMEAVGLPVIDTNGRWLVQDIDRLCRRIRGDDPYSMAVSVNIHRRHLTADQKRDLIAKLLKATPEKSNRRIAKAVGVSHPHVGKIRMEMETVGDVEIVSTSIDTKGRRQRAKRAIQPKTIISSFSGVPKKLTRGLPTGSTISAPQATVVEAQLQLANPIIAAWEAATWEAGTLEQRREFSLEWGENVVDMFMGRGRRSDDPLKYSIYKTCDAIEIDLGADDEELDSEKIAGLRADYKAAAEALNDLERQIRDARAEEEEEKEEEAAS
jgi:hypothetical protein